MVILGRVPGLAVTQVVMWLLTKLVLVAWVMKTTTIMSSVFLFEELETGEQTWRVESMLSTKGDTGQSGGEDGEINVAQFAVKAKGYLIAADKEATAYGLWQNLLSA